MHPADQQEFDKLHQERHKVMQENAEKDRVILDQSELIHELEDKIKFIKDVAAGDIETFTI